MTPAVPKRPLPYGRLYLAAEVLMAGAMLYVVTLQVSEWQAGASFRPLLLSFALLLGTSSQLFAARDLWRRELSYPIGRGRLQLALQLVAFLCLFAFIVLVDER